MSIEATILRSRRRTLEVSLRQDGRVLVRAPLRAPEAAIRDLLAEHEAWILRTREKMRRRADETPVRRYEAGERFPFLGRSHPLGVIPGAGTALRFDETRGFLLAETLLPRAKALFEAWYRREAKRACLARAAHYAERLGLRHARLTVRDASTRWGSCGPDGGLSFNWKLIMAPPEILDYVVIHELAHLAHRNHSKRFWTLVAAHCQWYREARAWLKDRGHTLTL